ncbi:Glutamate synthase [NADPH] putative GlxC chain [Micrococcus lylae]|uniref:Glutamate synthase [NADPH] putative GlxC chain n=1 Tax=Micrococcus lylae TaxID=1273 RepID=A0A1R4IYM1_9MICC|nr:MULTISPECIES: protein glxC [Micrococcus]MCT2007051.1 protein glxC [Micrococcus lylae]MCT2070849.1 protein glxC [Micrococcus lylae]TFH98201.1 protein glxC [Micrococcus lylae]WIK82532.1 protein glxC [Micrococcus lylae]SJN24794.1 Glutamate synthase [NADPH] putative GlxC chain [Micrococcus lylae]
MSTLPTAAPRHPAEADAAEHVSVDLAEQSVRELNAALHDPAATATRWTVTHPRGLHSIAVGVDREVRVDVEGHVGYYFGGMNKHATLTVSGSAGQGLAENIMSGRVHVHGDASQSAAATGRGGLVVIDGNASARCGISMKGVDIVVGGSVGHMSAFMAQAGRMVVCGDAGESLGDSIYEARLYVKGSVASLGTDCVEKQMRDEHRRELAGLLQAAGRTESPEEFRRYGSARRLYHFTADNSKAY